MKKKNQKLKGAKKDRYIMDVALVERGSKFHMATVDFAKKDEAKKEADEIKRKMYEVFGNDIPKKTPIIKSKT